MTETNYFVHVTPVEKELSLLPAFFCVHSFLFLNLKALHDLEPAFLRTFDSFGALILTALSDCLFNILL